MQTARDLDIFRKIKWEVAVPKERVERQFNFASFLLILLCLFTIAFFYVYQQALVTQEALQISKLKTEIRQQQTANQKTKIETEVLKSPGRIEQMALEIGMVKPEKVDYIILERKKVARTFDNNEKKGLIASVYSILQRQ